MYELHRAFRQDGAPCCTGHELKKHMILAGLTKRAFSVEDEVVKGWLTNPSSYPEELKAKQVFLWGSQEVVNNLSTVAYLVWNGNRVDVRQYELNYCCCSGTYLSLLRLLVSS